MLVPTPIRTTPSPLLAVRGLAVSYEGAVVALREVSVDLDEGRVLAVLGANGAGKTTLLRAISGLLGARHGTVIGGTVEVRGRRVDRLDPAAIVRLGVAHAMEGGRVFARLSVRENLDAGVLSRPRREVAGARERVLGLFPVLADRLATPAGSLSGGQQQLLGVARALMGRPRLLLLDEPNRGLAPDMRDALRRAIGDAQADGTAIVLVEQHAESALELAHDVIVLDEGAVRLSGPAADLRRHPDLRRSDVGENAPTSAGSVPTAPGLQAAPDPAVPTVLDVTDLTLRFGPVTALDGVTFSVGRDEVVAVVGANGAGKTSLLNCLNRAYVPTTGSIRVNGHDLAVPTGRAAAPADVARLGVARAFQAPIASPSLTVLDCVLLGRHRLMRAGTLASGVRTRRVRDEERANRERAREVACQLGLERWLDRVVAALPFGIQKRADLARAIAMDPLLLLMDEPASGLSEAEIDDMAAVLAGLRRTAGLSVLVVEHDLRLVTSIADRVMVMDAGRVTSSEHPTAMPPGPAAARASLTR